MKNLGKIIKETIELGLNITLVRSPKSWKERKWTVMSKKSRRKISDIIL